jgi:[protein-PII] uridylyltransferase
MLYLLTYIDVRSVGPGTWTHWKGAQLREVYEKTLHHLRTGEAPGENLEEALRASDLGEDECERVLEHCRQIDTPGYVREILPERMLSHVALAKRLAERGPLEVDTESFGDYHEVILCARDRSGLFTDFAGLLFSEGFNVLGARIYSRRDGVAIDQFWVEIADGVRVGLDVRVKRLREKFEAIERERTSARDLVLDRSSRYHGSRTFTALYGPRVVLNSQSSANYTVIEVNAGDRPGLLFDLASTLRELDLDVRTAKVSTFGERVHDVFWVLEASGGKIIDSERQKEIQNKLGRRAASIPAPAAGQ